LLTFAVLPLANAATIHGVASAYLSRPTSVGSCIKHGMGRWLPLIGTFILTSFAVGIGMVLLLIPGILFAFWFLLAQHVCVIENLAGSSAMGRSKKLMKGEILKTFVLLLIVGIINWGVSMASGLISQPYVQMIVSSLVQGVTTVFGCCATTLLYFSCRCKHDNFDLQMLAEAVREDA